MKQNHQLKDYLLFNIHKNNNITNLLKIGRNNIFINLNNNLKAIIIGYLFCLQILTNSAAPIQSKRSRYNYPGLDLKDLEWPEAQPIPTIDKNNENIVNIVECYTEIDSSLINSNVQYRINNSGEHIERACVLRIPTHLRISIINMNTFDNNSYVTIMAGSSDSYMPLSVKRIVYSAEKQRYGPYHIPCNKSYLVFNTNKKMLEWVDFKLEKEQIEDIEDDEEQFCKANDNTVKIEYI